MRLILSAVISMFLCFVVGFFLAVGMAWAVEWGNEAIAAYEDTSDQVAMALLWPPAKSRYGIISRIVFNAFGVGLYFMRLVLTPATCMCVVERRAWPWRTHSLTHSLTCSLTHESRCADDLVFNGIVPPAIAGLAFLVWIYMLVGTLVQAAQPHTMLCTAKHCPSDTIAT